MSAGRFIARTIPNLVTAESAHQRSRQISSGAQCCQLLHDLFQPDLSPFIGYLILMPVTFLETINSVLLSDALDLSSQIGNAQADGYIRGCMYSRARLLRMAVHAEVVELCALGAAFA